MKKLRQRVTPAITARDAVRKAEEVLRKVKTFDAALALQQAQQKLREVTRMEVQQ